MRYVCSICGYVYDEAKQGKPFAALPETWTCPLCGAARSAFAPEAAAKSAAPAPTVAPPAPVHGEMQKLSPGALSILCSNLARGCEKQYKAREAELFRELAGWYAAQALPAAGGSFDELLELVQRDLEGGYPAANERAAAAGDRGAKRALVWSEKVTRMLDSLLQQYRTQGDGLTQGTNVYVCEICGFVYVGELPPAICPVCKVPGFKLAKVERS